MTLVPDFLDELGEASQALFPEHDLELRLQAIVIQAEAKWPSLKVEPAAFMGRLAICAREARPPSLEALFTDDLYLATACLSGSLTAHSLFEEHFGSKLQGLLLRTGIAPSVAEEVAQQTRVHLLVASTDGAPKLARYLGRSPLLAWLRAVVVHSASSALRKTTKDVSATDSVLREEAVAQDPGLMQIRSRYGQAFCVALEDALGRLSPRERNLFRLIYLDGLTVEQVATMYGVHRVSASRWMSQARKSLLDTTRTLLLERLSVDADEVGSIARMCFSILDVSLDRILREGESLHRSAIHSA